MNAMNSEEDEKENSGGDYALPRRTRNKSPGVQLVGFKIDDSQNEKTCSPETMHFDASCKNQKNDKARPFRFFYKCLLNRYGEKIEEMELLCDWKCPKCRGVYNCSFCIKRKRELTCWFSCILRRQLLFHQFQKCYKFKASRISHIHHLHGHHRFVK